MRVEECTQGGQGGVRLLGEHEAPSITDDHGVERGDRQGCITRDTLDLMADVTIRELRNHGGDVVDRAKRGERLTITRAGQPVAQIVALRRPPIPLEELRRRWARLPAVDPKRLRDDVDAVLDPSI
jgi:prevent-host-death family protein